MRGGDYGVGQLLTSRVAPIGSGLCHDCGLVEKATGLRVGLLANFGTYPQLEDDRIIRRY
jgi:hypothetical protein